MASTGLTTPDLDLGPSGLLIDGSWREARGGETIEVLAPASEQTLTRIAAGGAEDVDAAVAAARAQLDGGVVAAHPGRARDPPLPPRRPDRGATPSASPGSKRSTSASRSSTPRIVDIPGSVDTLRHFAGWADKIDGRAVEALPALRPPAPRLHAARAGRRGRGDHALELAADDRLLEARARPGRRLHRRPEAAGGRAADHPRARRPVRGGGLPGRRAERGDRARRDRRRGARPPSRRRQDQLHRHARGRSRDRGRGGPAAAPGDARAGRQVAADRSSPTPTSRRQSPASRWGCSPTRARSAPPAPACSPPASTTTTSSTGSPRRPPRCGSAIRSTKRRRWAR